MKKDYTAAKTSDLENGQMMEIALGDQTGLLIRLEDQWRAYPGECPHSGAPLAEGILHDGRLRCPWHHTVFHAADGALEEPPAVDCLLRYEVRIEGEDIIVTVDDEAEAYTHPPMAKADAQADGRTFVIVGAGAAGMMAAQTLRREGFRGRVLMITCDRDVGYDRTDLSKHYMAGEEAPYSVRPRDFFGQYDIEILSERPVSRVDPDVHRILCEDGQRIAYDKLLLAMGGIPRRLGIEGEDLTGIFTLRTLADAANIRGLAKDGAKAVVVGASFIGMEVAASLTQRGVKVTVVAPEATPFETVFGPQVGALFRKTHEDEGVQFRLELKVERFEGDGQVERVILDNGEALETDLVVVGVGVRPATAGLEGLPLAEDGSVVVDAHMEAIGDIYAAGDVASFPDWRTGESIRIEHWRLAQQHGQTAARNMLGLDAPYEGVPFFWTKQLGLIVDYVGYTPSWDEIEIVGDVAEADFVALYLREGHVAAGAGAGRNRTICMIAERMKAPRMLSLDELRQTLPELAETHRV